MRIETSRVGSSRGFTLIELLIVLLIISVASSVVVISIGVANKKTVLRRAARETFLLLRHAREVSVMEKRPVRFEPLEDHSGFNLTDVTGTTIASYSLPEGFTLEAEEVTFFPFGNSTGGRVLLMDMEGRAYEILLEPTTGEIRLGTR